MERVVGTKQWGIQSLFPLSPLSSIYSLHMRASQPATNTEEPARDKPDQIHPSYKFSWPRAAGRSSRRAKMSWQTYVDEHLMCEIEGHHLTSAAIVGHDGTVWAQSAAFPQVTKPPIP